LLPFVVAAGCGSVSTTTAQSLCSTYESSAKRCGPADSAAFDVSACQADLRCLLGLYRTEVIDVILRCATRVKNGECKDVGSYFCDAEKATLTALAPTTAARDFAAAFSTRKSECQAEGVTLFSTFYDSLSLMRDYAFTQSKSCLEKDCGGIAACLAEVKAQLEPFCSGT
jgi:hypothetical protein